MNIVELPLWAALLTSGLIVLGALLTLVGTIGLLRLRSFYERVHAPTLGSTLGAGFILIASMVYFSVAGSRFVLHEILIAVFMVVTTPITLLSLVRAALYRDRHERRPLPPGSGADTDPAQESRPH
ncbi:MAG: monovalent cation/H(+) antiporter subunit G [Dokdonella sp.]